MSMNAYPAVTIAAGTPKALATATQPAAVVQVQANNGNTGTVFVGDSTVSASQNRGIPIASGQYFFLPAISSWAPNYDLAKLYVDGTHTGDVVNISYGNLNP